MNSIKAAQARETYKNMIHQSYSLFHGIIKDFRFTSWGLSALWWNSGALASVLGPFVLEACTEDWCNGPAPPRLILEAGVDSFVSCELTKAFPAALRKVKSDISASIW